MAGVYTGMLGWHKDTYACLGKKWWYAAVPKQQALQMGVVRFYYQPYTFGCPEDNRYDPTKYEVKYGEIVPRDSAN
jgi:hypothetical protein